MPPPPETPLAGWDVEAPERLSAAGRSFVRHLTLFGASPRTTPRADADSLTLIEGDGAAEYAVTGRVRWPEDASPLQECDPWPEASLQATSGLMAAHGWDAGHPRRLGLDMVSFAAAALSCAGVLAAIVARSRGSGMRAVETAAAGAAVALLAHHLGSATCGDAWAPPVGGSGPGPPFATSDGRWVEVDVLDPDRWGAFWERLGVDRGDLGASWLAFAFRHNTARCSLPASLHEATRRRTLAELRAAAAASGVAVLPVRGYDEVAAGWIPGSPPWDLRLGGPVPSPSASGAGRRAGGPLGGLRVVEVTSRVQGPQAGRTLALLGADVTRVEAPGGDPGRDAPPTAGTVGAAFLTFNHGKRALELDYKSGAGRDALIDLLLGADVFLHNWRIGRAEELRLTAHDLASVNAGLVYAHASGWGAVPDPTLPQMATDFLVQAHAGCGAGLNPLDEPPFPTRLTVADVLGGLVAAEGVLAALVLRERTGRGCAVHTSLLGAALDLQEPVLARVAPDLDGAGREVRPVWDALDRPLAAADGWLLVDATSAAARQRVAAMCGARDGDTEAIAHIIRAQPVAALLERLRTAGVRAEPVRTELGGLPQDPDYRGVIEDIDGACSIPGPPWCFT